MKTVESLTREEEEAEEEEENEAKETPVGDKKDAQMLNLKKIYKGLECTIEPCAAPEGLRPSVKMYDYQRRSVAKMLERESSKTCQGGILCEEMGTGKTLICIALILKTRGTISRPLSQFKVLHGVTLASLSSPSPSPSSSSSPFPSTTDEEEQNRGGLPPLKVLASSIVKCGCGMHIAELNLPQDIKELVFKVPPPFFFYALPSSSAAAPSFAASSMLEPVSLNSFGYSLRRRQTAQRNVAPSPPSSHGILGGVQQLQQQRAALAQWPVYLSCSTLIIVPNALLEQWRQELNKYVKDGYLSTLVCKDGDELPSPATLAAYDIVLTTHSRISKERHTSAGYQPPRTGCFCEWQTESHEPTKLCKVCRVYRKQSVLMQVLWLRVIVDEGHVVGRRNTKQAQLAADLLCERKWSCTGTPTPGAVLDQELENLFGLVKFLDYAPFCDRKHWSMAVVKPFKQLAARNNDGKGEEEAEDSQGSGEMMLKELLTSVMVKNSKRDIKREIDLPPCQVSVVRLPLQPWEVQKYNEFVAQIKTNLICSQRNGVDCYWHPSNWKYAKEALTNLHMSCFYIVGLLAEELALSVSESNKQLQDGKKLEELSAQDLKDLNRILEVMSHRLPSLSEISSLVLADASSSSSSSFISASAAASSSSSSSSSCSSSSSSSSSSSATAAADVIQELLAATSSSRKRKRGAKAPKVQILSKHINTANNGKTTQNNGESTDQQTPVPKLSARELKRLRDQHEEQVFEELLRQDVYSTKLDYLVERVLRLPSEAKVIVFSQFNSVLEIVERAFQVARIRYCAYYSRKNPAQRASALTTFNTAPTMKAIIMKTELAAFGINLTAATHIFFLDQPWEPSVERQAIKRAHRIGQTKPVFVEKLVAAHTIDDVTLSLNTESTSSESKKDSDLKEQRKVHSLLSGLAFLSAEHTAPPSPRPFHRPVSQPNQKKNKNKNKKNHNNNNQNQNHNGHGNKKKRNKNRNKNNNNNNKKVRFQLNVDSAAMSKEEENNPLEDGRKKDEQSKKKRVRFRLGDGEEKEAKEKSEAESHFNKDEEASSTTAIEQETRKKKRVRFCLENGDERKEEQEDEQQQLNGYEATTTEDNDKPPPLVHDA